MDGVDEIYTRIGIDFGDDKDVMWTVFGTENCNELTTLSLHTSLASKLQGQAKSNGIMVGQNVKNRVPEIAELFNTPALGDRHIYKDEKKQFFYGQFEFEWLRYLKTLPYVKMDANGDLFIQDNKNGIVDREVERRNRLSEATQGILQGTQGLGKDGHLSAKKDAVRFPENKYFYDPTQE